MPPKRFRPAAAIVAAVKARAKGKAKAKAKGAPKAVPKRRVGKRPAAAGVGTPGKEAKGEGEAFESAQTTLEQCRGVKDIEILEGSYWDEEISAALRVHDIKVKNGHLHFEGQILGTQTESLLRAASGIPGKKMVAHLCPADCAGTPHAEDLLHVRKWKRLGLDREPWMSNLLEAEERREGDDLRALREEQEKRRIAGEAKAPGKEKEEGDEAGEEESTEEKSESKEEKKKKKKKKDKEKKKKKFKVAGTKPLKSLFGHTGLDPSPKVRRRFKKRASKVARKKKEDEEGGSSGGSGTSSSTGSLGDHAMFGGSSRVSTIGRRFPQGH